MAKINQTKNTDTTDTHKEHPKQHSPQVGLKRVHVLYDMNVKMVYTRYTNNMLNAYDMTSPITVDDSDHMQEYWSH